MRGSLPILLDGRLRFPDPAKADAQGLVAVGGDLSVERLLLAYRSGIFPWTADPITWWSPDPRGIFELAHFHVPRSLERTLRKKPFEVTCDRAFRDVVRGCALARRQGNWITREFVEAYARLHEAGHAHSVESWQEGHLVGGIYGVAVGGLFAGESMFHKVSEASKVALVHLVETLRANRYALFDIQMVTEITQRLGAIEVSRADYLARLREVVELDCRFDG